jgi:large subunit ribosomal protein L19
MALNAIHKENSFGVGDRVRVVQRIEEDEKKRLQTFEGIVIGIKGKGEVKTFTMRRIGAGQVGIEKIFPLNLPSIERIEVVRQGQKGTRKAKLYYIRGKANREIEKIYSRNAKRQEKKKKAAARKETKTKVKAKRKTSKKKTSSRK